MAFVMFPFLKPKQFSHYKQHNMKCIPAKKCLNAVLAMLMVFAFYGVSFSQAIIYSGFEDAKPPSPPPGWSVSNTGNANWQSLKNFMGSGNALKGQKCMYLANSYYGDQSDAWLFTPKFHMEAGKKYSFSFYYKNQVNGSSTMDVTLGSDSLPAAQTEVVWSKKISSFFYEEGQVNYTAKETGDKVLAFHCTTPKTYLYVYLDEVIIKQVNCFEPLNIGVKNITTGSADFSWDAVDGTMGYAYGISDTTSPPKRFQKTASNKVSISGLKPGKQYYFYVRSACTETSLSDWTFKSFPTAYDAATIENLNCGTVLTNNFKAKEGNYKDAYCGIIYGGAEFFHKFTPLVSGYYTLDVFAVNTGQYMRFLYKEAAGGADPDPDKWTCIAQDINDWGGKARFGPLEAGKEYIIMEKARAGVNLPSSYSYAIECYASQPANDSCDHPQNLVPSAFSESTKGDIIYTIGATGSYDLKVNYNECGGADGTVTDDEVWIKFTANSNQQLFRITDLNYLNINFHGSTPGIYFSIFSDSCDLRSMVDCGYIEAYPKTVKEFYSYKLAKGKTYYCRLFTADQFTYAKLRLSIMPLDIAKGTAGQCTGFLPYTIDQYTDRNNTDEFVPFTDNAYKLISLVNANGNTLDNVTGGLYINDGAVRQDAKGVYYLDRNVTINSSAPLYGPVQVKLLISNEELDRLINMPGSRIKSVKDINVTQNDDNCSSVFSSNKATFIIPYFAKDYNEHYKIIEFLTSKLGSFYMHGGKEALSGAVTPSYAVAAENSQEQANVNSGLTVYPNPAKSKFNIAFSANKTEKCMISITSMQGKQVKSFVQNSLTGRNQFSVDASSLPAGMYIIKVERRGNVQYAKVMKQ